MFGGNDSDWIRSAIIIGTIVFMVGFTIGVLM